MSEIETNEAEINETEVDRIEVIYAVALAHGSGDPG